MPMIEVSNGEVIDRFTILVIKLRMVKNELAKKNIEAEIEVLTPIVRKIWDMDDKIIFLDLKLFDINKKLWNVEDELRIHEKHLLFDDEFVRLARSVYKLNDERAKLKREINEITNSNIVEEKLYEQY